MKNLNKEIKDCILEVKISVLPEEFNKAREKAYLNNTDKYIVPGVAGGLASLEILKKTYGPAVLYDEALEILIPEAFNKCLEEDSLRVIGKPQVKDIEFLDDGGVSFHIHAELYPKVALGEYKGLSAGNGADFEETVLQMACEQMSGEVPKHLVENKLNAMAAQEKLKVINDAIYHVLADTVQILKQAYNSVGLSRPLPQVRAEALDIMLQTVSGDNKEMSREFFAGQIMALVKRYRDIPENFNTLLEEAIAARTNQKKKMKPEEMMDEVFKAYLGSLELSEEQWRKERMGQAAKATCHDLLFDAVAQQENLHVSDEEVQNNIVAIAQQCQVEVEDVKKEIDIESLKSQLLRDKAKELILASAVVGETEVV